MATASPAPEKIDIGAVLQGVVDTYGKTLTVLIPAALIVYTPVALIAAITSDSAAGGLLASIVALIASAWYTGMVVRTVQDVQDGRVDATIGQLFSSVTNVILTLILVGLVVGICVVFGLILLIVPGLIILTLWSVASPAVVVEDAGVFEALGRSRELVRGNGWQVFGVIVSVFAIILVVSVVIGSIGAIGDSFLLIFIVQLLLNVALAPIFSLAAAVLYFALRAAQGQPVQMDPATGAFAPPQAPVIAPGADAFGNPQPPSPGAPPSSSP
jgi:hypothetical protein